MIKFLSYLSVFLAVSCVVLFNLYSDRGDKIKALEEEKNALTGQISFLHKELEARNDKALETSQRIAELEKAAESVDNFDWYRDISRDPVVLKLKEK